MTEEQLRHIRMRAEQYREVALDDVRALLAEVDRLRRGVGHTCTATTGSTDDALDGSAQFTLCDRPATRHYCAAHAAKRRDPAVGERWYALLAEAYRRGITLYELMQLPWEELQDIGK